MIKTLFIIIAIFFILIDGSEAANLCLHFYKKNKNISKLSTLAFESATIELQTPLTADTSFHPIKGFRYDGEDYSVSQAQLGNGAAVVILNKHRERPYIEPIRLIRLLGNTGQIISNASSMNPSINCHSYAMMLSRIPGWPSNAWLDAGRMSYSPGRSDSLSNLIKEYFFDTGIGFSNSNSALFDRTSGLKTGDYVLMSRRNFQGGLTVVHSGIVTQGRDLHGVFNIVESKLEENMVVHTPLANLVNSYSITGIRVFRRRLN